MPKQPKYKEVSIDVPLGSRTALAMVNINPETDRWQLVLRYVFERNGEVIFTRQGINIDMEFGTDAIEAMIMAYNQATGEFYELVEGVIDED
jgi:hypothetical protein